MINRTVDVLVKDADPREFVDLGIGAFAEIVEHALLARPLRKRHVKIEIEIAGAGGNPAEFPAHSLTICVQPRDRSARDRDKADIVMLEMLPRAVDLVGEQ